jgi:hypothetical protein
MSFLLLSSNLVPNEPFGLIDNIFSHVNTFILKEIPLKQKSQVSI